MQVFSKQLVSLLQQLVQCILATCTLCCYNPWFRFLHATIIVLLLACFNSCLHASVLLQCCLHASFLFFCMLPWFCCLHACMMVLLSFHEYVAHVVACFHRTVLLIMLPWFCYLHASIFFYMMHLLLTCISTEASHLWCFNCLVKINMTK